MERFGSSTNLAEDETTHELRRLIGRLNADFDLHLHRPDLEGSRSQDNLNDALLDRIQALHHKRDHRLFDALGQFEVEARRLLRANASGSRSFASSRLGPGALQRCLLDILPDVRGGSLHADAPPHGSSQQAKWKRISRDPSESSHKRPRALWDTSYSNVVDALPVRSRAPTPANYPEYIGSLDMAMDDVEPSTSQDASFMNSKRILNMNKSMNMDMNRTMNMESSFDSTQMSNSSSVFSSANARMTANSSQLTMISEYTDSPDPSAINKWIDSARHDVLPTRNSPAIKAEERFSHEQVLERRSITASPHPPHLDDASFVSTEREPSPYSSFNTMSSSQLSSQGIHKGKHEILSGSLEEKLVDVWPRFPGAGFNEAPLAVLWELTRAALHCGVNLGGFDLKYDPNDDWHEQSKMRAKILGHHLFRGKELPPPSDSMAWKVALNGFQGKEKAIALRIELKYNDETGADGPLYKVHLHPLKAELAHRLDRRFGADRFLEVLIPSPTYSKDRLTVANDFDAQDLMHWLTQKPHNFLGRHWVPFYVRDIKHKGPAPAPKAQGDFPKAKEASVFQHRLYLFATHGHIFRPPQIPGTFPPHTEALTPETRTTMKLSSLLEWAVNVQKNADQPVTKLFSRLVLSLSRTWPTVVLERSQIRIRAKDLGTDQVMNDGIARMSRPLAVKVADRLGLSDCPSAFQARLGSAKGMWIIDVNDEDPDEEWIEIYPSQEKWKCDFSDPHHRTFEVRCWPKELKSAGLNMQFIPVLEAQSINRTAMRFAISEHLTNALRADLDAQSTAMEGPLDLRLWVLQSGLVAKGDRSLYNYTSFLGGLPDDAADKVGFLLDSGFDQRRMAYLKDLVWDLFKRKTDLLKTKMNITIPCSSFVYMAADFSSTLEEDEVHLSFSTKFQVEGFSDTLLEDRDILVARAPAHFPSDIQRVRVVSRPELRKLKDVIVFSTKGKSPLADKLSGGDYDGDLAWVCWDPKIANNFCNAPVPETPDLFKEGYLGKHKLKFEDLMKQAKQECLADGSCDAPLDRACGSFMLEAFSFGLCPSLLGMCTKYKERLCYRDDEVTSPAAIKLSALLSNLVDQSKQGILFSPSDWNRFRRRFIKTPSFLDYPAYATAEGSRKTEHVLDYLRFDVAGTVIDETLTALHRNINSQDVQSYDADLVKLHDSMYDAPTARATGCKEVIDQLRKDIDQLATEWKTTAAGPRKSEDGGYPTRVRQFYQKWVDMKPPARLMSTPFAQEIMRDWGVEPNLCAWQLLKASTTFKHHYAKSYSFIWNMAGRQLGFIKGRMRDNGWESAPVLVIPEMWRALKPDKKLILSLAAKRGAAKGAESAEALEEVIEVDEDGTVIDDA